jgi:hypothetical protein
VDEAPDPAPVIAQQHLLPAQAPQPTVDLAAINLLTLQIRALNTVGECTSPSSRLLLSQLNIVTVQAICPETSSLRSASSTPYPSSTPTALRW